ncbi:MAG: tetratricopeptide repeat protein [Bacteroidales bacterium]|nr:tetratricopeptide repeat protein [Bacteroidales bacterium]
MKLFLVFTFSVAILFGYSQDTGTFDSLSKALIQTNDEKTKINILLTLSSEVERSQPENGINYAASALEIAIKHHLSKETILSYIHLSKCHIRLSNYSEAMNFAELAIDLAKESEMKDETARSRALLALIYYELGNYEQSAKLDFENLSYYEQIDNKKETGLVLGNIGIDFISQNNYEKGLEYLKKSFDIAVATNDYHGMAYQYNNIAGVYSEYFNDHKIALGYYKEALEINKKLGDKQQQGIYLMNIGNCYSRLNQNDSVMPNYIEASKIFKNLNNPNLFSDCQTLIGDFYLKTHNLPLSLCYADTGFIISKNINIKENLKAAANLLHRIYLNKKDTIQAYKYSIIENEIKDSLVILQNQKEVYKLESQYNYEKKDKIKQIARQKKETLMLVTILSLVSGLVITLLFFSRHRIKSKIVYLEKQSIEKELQFKDKELTINLISLIKKNELLTEISHKLFEIGKSAKKDETIEAINKIHRELRNSADDKMLKEFTLRFQEIHSGFYEVLLQKFPELTQNELKLCAFLRLNMSSKEISDLTGQRILTLDQARYRLRKKLGISNSEVNLVTFLSQI